MTAKEVKEKETPALNEELSGLRRKVFDLRTQSVTEKVEDTSQFGKIRKDIARIMTELHGRSKKAAGTKASTTEAKK